MDAKDGQSQRVQETYGVLSRELTLLESIYKYSGDMILPWGHQAESSEADAPIRRSHSPSALSSWFVLISKTLRFPHVTPRRDSGYTGLMDFQVKQVFSEGVRLRSGFLC